jgi:hypothetical protein
MENEGFGRGIVGVCATSDVCKGVGAGVVPGPSPWIHPQLIAPAKMRVRKMKILFFIWVSVGDSSIIFFINVLQGIHCIYH